MYFEPYLDLKVKFRDSNVEQVKLTSGFLRSVAVELRKRHPVRFKVKDVQLLLEEMHPYKYVYAGTPRSPMYRNADSYVQKLRKAGIVFFVNAAKGFAWYDT